MTHEELRVLLIEQGAKIATAKLAYRAARHEYAEAIRPLVLVADQIEAQFNIPEQHACFLKSCELAGIDPDHPDPAHERRVFRAATVEDTLLDQLDNAPMN